MDGTLSSIPEEPAGTAETAYISAFSPFGMDNMKKHSLRVNISDPQSGDFRSSQAAVIAKIDHSSETDIGRT